MALLAIAVRESIRLLTEELGGRELSLVQVSALMTLAGAPGAVPVDDLGATAYDLSILGDGLGRSIQGRGLVKTAKEGRRLWVSLTAKGEALRRRLEALEAGARTAPRGAPHAVPAYDQWPRRGLGMVA
jgi:DNA-binding MarR family transcriptional regulator